MRLPIVPSSGKNAGTVVVSSSDVQPLFQRLLPMEHFDRLSRCDKLRENNRVYNAPVVIWLMINQRLQGSNLASSVLELICGLPSSFWPRPCKRLMPGPEGRS